jgi:hypothetical protein
MKSGGVTWQLKAIDSDLLVVVERKCAACADRVRRCSLSEERTSAELENRYYSLSTADAITFPAIGPGVQ